MSDVFLFVLLTFVVHRVTRFVWLDDLINEPRNWIRGRLMLTVPPEDVEDPDVWLEEWHQAHARQMGVRRKLYELTNCGWCISVWVAAAVVASHHFLVDPLAVPIWWVVALSGSSTVVMEWTDGIREVRLKQEK